MPVSGWVVLDKPAGLGSTPAVALVKRAFGAAKAGHAGTLDPAATGVLAVALGEATKTVSVLESASKTYRFAVRWGAETTTDDADGDVLRRSEERPTRHSIAQALAGFRGLIVQVPPQVSAVKVGGVRAYDLARDGVELNLAARPLMVERLELEETPDDDLAVLMMECGKGGYVRSIARDLGRRLGCLGHVAWLRRERSGPFSAAQGWAPHAIVDRAQTGSLDACLLPVEAALAGLRRLNVAGADEARRLRTGMTIIVEASDGPAWAALDGRAVALGHVDGRMFRPTRVLAPG